MSVVILICASAQLRLNTGEHWSGSDTSGLWKRSTFQISSNLYVISSHLLPASITSIYYHLPNFCLCISQLRMGPSCRSSQQLPTVYVLVRATKGKNIPFPSSSEIFLWRFSLQNTSKMMQSYQVRFCPESVLCFVPSHEQKGRQLCLCLHGDHDFVGVKVTSWYRPTTHLCTHHCWLR